ncbi:hypothetical protein C8R45DRAFT_1113940 [Mycena sanguinolenta]|nr:hypothetical protein C8R45DRAFT_1113940 [Mycena sanguinolenta]
MAKDIQTRLTPFVTRGQLIEANDKGKNGIVDAGSAREYLEDSLWIAKGAPFTRGELFFVLMKVSLLPQVSLKMMAHTLRALAFMGEEIDVQVAEEVAGATGPAVTKAMAPMMDSLKDSVVEMIGKSSDAVDVVEAVKGEVAALKEQVTELKKVVEETRTAAAAAAKEAQAAAKATPTAPRSYATAAVAPATMTAEQAELVARDARMRRQILVDKDKDAAVNALAALTEMELKEKANMALALMPTKREGSMIVGARKLGNGGVVFDCKDDAMSKWLKGTELMKEFVAALGGSVTYRLRSVTLIAEMVPVDLRIEVAGTWRMIESDSGLEDGAIAGGQWVKAPLRRSLGQRVAHLKVDFTTSEAANHAIDHGIYWQGRNIRVRKSDDEPSRCVKCQGLDGHFAAACKSTVDICGRCAEHHRTTDCTAEARKCANCGVDGHGAVDRNCPFFQKAARDKRANDPTAGYSTVIEVLHCGGKKADEDGWQGGRGGRAVEQMTVTGVSKGNLKQLEQTQCKLAVCVRRHSQMLSAVETDGDREVSRVNHEDIRA